MAKRSRKARKNNTSPVKPITSAPVAQKTQKVQKTPKARVVKTVDFAQEYVYVYGDMRTIAIVTALMVVAVFALSFVF